MNPNSKKINEWYRSEIDGLRALAVLSVLIFHAFPSLMPGGFIGVDIFFVISGYLITGNILREIREGVFSFKSFYKRRIRRIFPALIVVLFATLAFGYFALLPVEYAGLGKHSLLGALSISNLGFYSESGYFDAASVYKPLLHLWSLGVEEQFYFLWPILLILLFSHRRFFYLGLTFFIIISFVLALVHLKSNQAAAFYLPHSRFWELAFGGILAAISPDSKISNTIAGFGGGLGVIFLVAGLLVAREGPHFPGYVAILPVVGTGILIVAGRKSKIVEALFTHRAVVFLGLLSYPLYLWHWPLLSYGAIITGGSIGTGVRLTLVVLSIVLAYFTYRYVEVPLRYRKWEYLTFSLIASMAIFGVVGLLIHKSQGLPNRPTVAKQKEINEQLVGTTWKYTKNTICTSQYPDTFRYFCSKKLPLPPTFILLGDSYANHLYGGLVENKEFAHHNIISYGSCTPGGYKTDCEMQEKIILENKSIRFAIINYLWPRLNDLGQRVDIEKGGQPEDPSNLAELVKKFLQERIDFLRRSNVKVVIFYPKPEVVYEARTCFARPFADPVNSCRVSMEEVQRQQKGIRKVLDELKKINPEVLLFEQNDLFCDGKNCLLVQNGLPLLRDHRHYSEYGSRLIIKRFSDWAAINLPEILKPN